MSASADRHTIQLQAVINSEGINNILEKARCVFWVKKYLHPRRVAGINRGEDYETLKWLLML